MSAPPAAAKIGPELLRILPTLLAALFLSVLTCTCGHHGGEHLALFGFTALWIRWAHVRPRLNLIYGALVGLGCLLATKTVLDLLWRGHDPLLAQRPEHLIVPLDVSVCLSLFLVSYGTLFWLRVRARDSTAADA